MILKDTILREAIKLARKRPLGDITRRQIASAAGAGTGTVNYHYESMAVLRGAVVAHAIETEDIEVLARIAGDPRIIGKLTPELKQRVATHIAGK